MRFLLLASLVGLVSVAPAQRDAEGTYSVMIAGGRITRKVILSSGGRAEMITAYRGQSQTSDRLEREFGATVVAAARENREVRQSGRWSERNKAVEIRLDRWSGADRPNDLDERTTIVFNRRENTLNLVRADVRYFGTSLFRVTRGPSDNGGDFGGSGGSWRPPVGSTLRLRYKGRTEDIRDIDLNHPSGNAILTVKTRRDTLKLGGKADPVGNRVLFYVQTKRGTSRYLITLRSGQILSIEGSGWYGDERLEFSTR